MASIEDALAASPVVVEATYSTATQNHAAIEPHSAVALWADGELTVYSRNQAANLQAMELASAMDVDLSGVRAVNPFVGGAFGGKGRPRSLRSWPLRRLACWSGRSRSR